MRDGGRQAGKAGRPRKGELMNGCPGGHLRLSTAGTLSGTRELGCARMIWVAFHDYGEIPRQENVEGVVGVAGGTRDLQARLP